MTTHNDITNNTDLKTVHGFGEQWSRFDQSQPNDEENRFLFERYFSLFPWGDLADCAQGFDMGVGSGRWARMVAPRVGHLICVDASDEALEVSKRNLSGHSNVSFLNESVGDFSIPDNSMDFGYSLGVLHHLPDTQGAIDKCVDKLKPGSPLLLYLYYSFDNKPLYYRFFWRLSEVLRWMISSSPRILKNALCEIAATLIYWPLARISWVLDKAGLPVDTIPLSDYKNATFYRMRHNARDRLGTPLEKRFSKEEIRQMMQ